jgi:uncharacterized protein
VIYVDSSALVKLVLLEDETAALRAFLADRAAEQMVSSSLLIVEVRRAVQRVRPSQLPRVDVILSDVMDVAIGDGTIESASRLPDPALRSLDAIHLATALLIRDKVDVLITYDKRLAEAAQARKIPTVAPC